MRYPSISSNGHTLAGVSTLDRDLKYWDLDSGKLGGVIPIPRRELSISHVLGCVFGSSATQFTVIAGEIPHAQRIDKPHSVTFHSADFEKRTLSKSEGVTAGMVEALAHLPALNSYVTVVSRFSSNTAEGARFQLLVQIWRENFRGSPTELPLDDLTETEETRGRLSKLTLSSDGRRFAAISPSGQVRIWDTTTLIETSSHKLESIVKSAALSPDGSQLAVSFEDDPTLSLLDTTSWEVGRSWSSSDSSGFLVAYSPDGRWIATATDQGVIRLWDTTFVPTKAP